jgi:hypothetical protein
VCLPVADVRVYDLPIQTIPLRTKSRTGATRYRRCALAACAGVSAVGKLCCQGSWAARVGPTFPPCS